MKYIIRVAYKEGTTDTFEVKKAFVDFVCNGKFVTFIARKNGKIIYISTDVLAAFSIEKVPEESDNKKGVEET